MKSPPVIDADAAVEIITLWIDQLKSRLTVESSRLRLRRSYREMVRAGTLPISEFIHGALGRDAEADMALRQLGAEMLSRGQEMPPELAEYITQYALFVPPVTHPRGRNRADVWQRNIAIGLLVSNAMERWNLKPTRNRASTRPSACSLVSAALIRRGIQLDEAQVERIFRDQRRISERLSAAIPPSDADDTSKKV